MDKPQPCDKECRAFCPLDKAAGSSAESADALRRRLSRIRHKVVVLSGKGGVGKSTVAVNVAAALALAGRRVGLLDVDLHGPSVPVLLGLQGAKPQVRQGVMEPVSREPGLKVMSVGFMLPGEEDAVIWRGPAKTGVIRQFLKDVVWGDLDFLVIDCPPGTGDEPLSLVRLIEGLDGAVVVTTPQRVAVADVRRSVGFCRKVGLAVLGVVENMSGLVCPHCGQVTAVFSAGGGERMAAEAGVPFLGRIPMDPAVVECSDAGAPYVVRHPDTATSAAFRGVAQALLDMADRPATA